MTTYHAFKDEWLCEMERLTEQQPEADMDELKALAMTNVLKTNTMTETAEVVTCHYCECEIDDQDMSNTYIERWDEFVCDNPDCLLKLMEDQAGE